MHPSRGWRSAWLLLIAGLLVGACNVFDVSSPEPNTVDALLADAQTALAADEASRAVRLLERAFDKDSTDVRVRVELGNALYADRGLDVFTLRAAAEHLVELSKSSKAPSTARSVRENTVCTDGARPEMSADRYDSIPLDADPVRPLVEHASTVERVRRLVVGGVLERRAEALASARARYRRKGLLVGAVTGVATGVVGVHAAFDTTDGSLYLDREFEPDRALVACAGTDDALGRRHDALCALDAAARRGVQWLQDRNRSAAEDRGSVLIDRLQDLAAAASARIDCS
jgi:hypothetical protein